MKSSYRNIVARVSAALAFAGLLGAVHAAPIGTAAGTTIDNMATIDYSIGGVTQSTLKSCATACTSTTGSNTSFVVDNKVNVLVTIPNTAYVTGYPGSTVAGGTAVATFTVTNQGNKTQDFDLSAQFNFTGAVTVSGFASPSVTDNFNPTACTAYIEDGTPGYQGTEPTYIDELLSGDSKLVTVACAIPGSQAKSDIAVISLKATALAGGSANSKGAALTETTGANTAGEDIVFADAAGVATGDVARDGAHSAYNAIKVIKAQLTTQKTVATLCDPLNGNTNPKDIPGAFVRYTIAITNTGAVGDADATDATLTTLTDALAAALTFDDDLIAGASAAQCITSGTATSAAGKGFGVTVTGSSRTGNGVTSYKTTTAGDADGASAVSGTVTLDFSKLLPVDGAYTAGLLKKGGEAITVIFNAKIN
jgi:hypothetical protein